MADLQSMILGAPTDEEQARLMAQSLRGQRNAADVFALSTVPEVREQAQGRIQQVDQAAQRGGALRQTTLNRLQQQKHHEERMAAQEKNRQLQLTLEVMKQSKAAQGKTGKTAFDKMPVSVQKEHIAARNTMEQVPNIIKEVEKNRDAFGMYAVPSAHMPEWTPNFILEPMKNLEQGEFTQNERTTRYDVYSRAYKIIHELAGAQVSAHEKARIEGFLPAPNDSWEVVRDKLNSALTTAGDIQTTNERLYGDVSEQKVESLQEVGEDNWVLMEDANGNRAEVNQQTGEIREIP